MAKVIGTHNGQFHCDEVLACYMLKQLPLYKDATIVRSDSISSFNRINHKLKFHLDRETQPSWTSVTS